MQNVAFGIAICIQLKDEQCVFSLFYFALSKKRGNFAHYFYLLTH